MAEHQDLQNYIDNFGFGISVQNLCGKAYWQMKADGHEVCIINDRYLVMIEFQGLVLV